MPRYRYPHTIDTGAGERVTQPLAPRAILFDIGNTILEQKGSIEIGAGINAIVRDAERAAALTSEFKARHQEYKERLEELCLVAWLVAEISELGAEPQDVLEDRIWEAAATLVPVPGAVAVFARLAEDGIPYAVVSNAPFSGRVLRAELARHGLDRGVRFVLSSADAGSRKPSGAIFSRAVGDLGLAPDQVWFVGDTVAEDIVGARNAGLQPVLFAGITKPPTVDPGVPTVLSWEGFLDVYATARRPS